MDSVLGQGSTFRVYLPSVAAPGETAPSDQQQAVEIRQGHETVLVVEDENAVRRVLSQVLQQNGYTVIEASNGKEALKIANELRDGEIDLLLTDVVMPVLGGRALANEFKGLHPSAKILYTSGYTDDETVRSGSLDSNSAFMRKPFTLSTLSQSVHALLTDQPPSRAA